MKIRHLLIVLTLVLFVAGVARADMEAYLNSLTAYASADLGRFRADLGAHFGASGPDIDLALRTVSRHGDAALCLWLSNRTRQPIDVVLREYQARKGQGWGALAQSLGIKPGSADFHALKRGDLGWHPENRGDDGGKGKGQGKGKGRNK
ncbi:MAG: hypothetical protein RBT64_11005 [Trichloromonas sp.]|jgi:hypothetical protein|nr:hypothetical protein [Trichloromonas sp.]